MNEEQLRSQAMLSLVMGLMGLMACQLTGPFAVWFAWQHKKAADALGLPTNPMALIGGILGLVATGMLALGVGFVVLYLGALFLGMALSVGLTFLLFAFTVLTAAL